MSAPTSIELLTAQAYAELEATRAARAEDFVSRAKSGTPASTLSHMRATFLQMAPDNDRVQAKLIAKHRFEQICDRRTEQNVVAIEDARIERAARRQPKLGLKFPSSGPAPPPSGPGSALADRAAPTSAAFSLGAL